MTTTPVAVPVADHGVRVVFDDQISDETQVESSPSMPHLPATAR
jgi:hypothetical protein